MGQQLRRFFIRKLQGAAHLPTFWIMVLAALCLASISWRSVWLLAAFIIASILAWITHDAKRPSYDDWF